ncbi:MAG: metallophosphoesterase [Endomicrobium sp.]|jgi:predicted MPP superfamily phosphohydrolase|nr:metallophosphoesterase [Endomicrobium sp.]
MFIIFALFLYFGAFAYAAWRVSSGLSLKSPYSAYLFAVVGAISVIALLSFLFSRKYVPVLSDLAFFGCICMGALGISVCFLILNDIINLPFLKIANFRFYSTIITLILIFISCVWSLINASFILRTSEITLKVPNLKVDSLKVVLLADLHITSYTNPQTIKNIFTKVSDLNPDIVVIAGDVIDTDLNEKDKFLNYGFELLNAKYGVYAITGNHEYYTGLNSFLEMFKKLNIPVLQNGNILVENIINVAGINDIDYKNPLKIKEALSEADKNYPIIFLSHRPESFDEASKQAKNNGFNLIQLSGHTHAGQIPPVEIIRRFFMKYNYGLYEENGSKMYITSGTRFWGPPMRLFNTSEIAVINLEAFEN